jgi:hypothetical protein
MTRKVGGGNINGGVNGCSRQFWWAFYLKAKVGKVHGSCRCWGMVEKEDEKVEEGVDLRKKYRYVPLK